MASIDKCIEALERTYGTEPEVDTAEMARRREELRAKLERPHEKVAREEAEGYPAGPGRIALEDLEERMKERIRVRRGA